MKARIALFSIAISCLPLMLACAAGNGSNQANDGDSDGHSDGDAGGGAGGDLGFEGAAGSSSGSDAECGDADYTGGTLAIPDVLGVDYETSVTISGFGDGAVLDDVTKFLGVCVNMEHSWIRDLQIELETPSGTIIILNEFLGREGGEVYLGEPDDTDDENPNPGIGYDYCWTPTASNPPMLDYCNANFGSTWTGADTLPPGAYQASDSFDDMAGTELNGTWTLRCIDDWAIDNGYIFYWDMHFDSSLVPDCEEWVVR